MFRFGRERGKEKRGRMRSQQARAVHADGSYLSSIQSRLKSTAADGARRNFCFAPLRVSSETNLFEQSTTRNWVSAERSAEEKSRVPRHFFFIFVFANARRPRPGLFFLLSLPPPLSQPCSTPDARLTCEACSRSPRGSANGEHLCLHARRKREKKKTLQ